MITPDDALAHVSLLVHSLPPQPFVDGAFRATAHGETLDNVSPRDGTSINRIARCTTADVDLAVANAKATFDAGQWRHMAPRDRKRLLLHFADLIEAQAEDFALLECIDTGKPISATRSFDIPQAINTLRYYAEAIDKVYGEVGPSPASRLSYAVHEPLGVIGVIVPWNFPLHLAMWKIAPALATGNTLVMKPSELTSLTALKLARTAIEGGLPAGVLNVVTGLGHEAGDALARHMDVQLIAFTGSERTGRQLLRAAADSNLKRVSLELGGKSPHIVFADWQDLDMVATQAAWGIFYNQGQVCTAGSRLLVERAVMETVLDRVTAVASNIIPADPLDEATNLGALSSKGHLEAVLAQVDRARADGLSILCGGQAARTDTGGYYMLPTIIADVPSDHPLAQEEIFGPLLCVTAFDTDDEALSIANGTRYGLAAGLWTASMNRAHRFADALVADMVWINGWDSCDITMPFGGFRQSGFGRDRSIHALEKYCDVKVISHTFG
ncbi:aldehyde dehydrogenase [Sphingobium xenophagum]|uniref:aldehyde dehydrogenase n=1 Tax=Sphingobium xenophagum TaxID=121428 RepID=UPI002420286E|nr:aldehyde dehydrogenase [Sphingobium xenophagum]